MDTGVKEKWMQEAKTKLTYRMEMPSTASSSENFSRFELENKKIQSHSNLETSQSSVLST